MADPYLFASERQIINDLIEEKKKLEEDLKQVIQLRNTTGASARMNISPIQSTGGKNMLSDFKSNIPNKEQLNFLNSQLGEALSEIVENIDATSKRALNYLSTK